MTTDELIGAILDLGLPSQRYAEALRTRERDYRESIREHKKLGGELQRRVARRLRRRLPGWSLEVRSHGYIVDWTRDSRGRPLRPRPVEPYLSLVLRRGQTEVRFTWRPRSAKELDQLIAGAVSWLEEVPR